MYRIETFYATREFSWSRLPSYGCFNIHKCSVFVCIFETVSETRITTAYPGYWIFSIPWVPEKLFRTFCQANL